MASRATLGAQRIVAGYINAFGTANGLAAHDAFVIDVFTAKLKETEITNNKIVLFTGGTSSLDVSTATARDVILTDANGKTTITAASGTVAHVIGTNVE